MAHFRTRRIIGKWSPGYARIRITVSSVFLGHDQYGLHTKTLHILKLATITD